MSTVLIKKLRTPMIQNKIKIELPPFDNNSRYLIYGIGNDCRQDDGLGIKFIEKLEFSPLPSNIILKNNFQLNIEDALEVSQFDYVFFVDASEPSQSSTPYFTSLIQPSLDIQFSTHNLSIESVLALSQDIYNKSPKAFLIGIYGKEWEIFDQLSPCASDNLIITLDHFYAWLRQSSRL